jgi:S-adenosylmethionine synthetase
MNSFFFTSESVSQGHPDKTCDIISDALLDHFLSKESDARCAFECFATTNNIIIGGETRLKNHKVTNDEVENLVRQKLKEIGHNYEGFSFDTVKITNLIHKQSEEIAHGVDANSNKEEGAGDQGIMFGYACMETPMLMPAPIFYAHKILQHLAKYKNHGLGPDAKSQVTFEYVNGVAHKVSAVIVSIQHAKELSLENVRTKVMEVLEEVLPNMPVKEQIFINPAGTFVMGGPVADTGLTGRKIIVDTYGGSAPHGGGAFSGKDPTKVDRSAAYIARYLAKNIVNAGIAQRCTIQLSYAIGIAKPISVYVNTHGTTKGHVSDFDLSNFINKNIDLTPYGIRTRLKLNNPIYEPTASFGHFGREFNKEKHLFLWEECDLKEVLQKWFN